MTAILRKVFGKKSPIEAHQVALVAAATAVDISWDREGRPTTEVADKWRKASEALPAEDYTEAGRELLDREQVYYQAFIIERCLEGVGVASAGLAHTMFSAWNQYLVALPQKCGILFDAGVWRGRQVVYARAWDAALSRAKGDASDRTSNPFFETAACLIEDVCGFTEDTLRASLLLSFSASSKARAFYGASREWIVKQE